ncbi:PP2C family protein-serine/threonine phosphatase [Dactylosporangium matsuzakiense]|uniref:Cyclic diguanylate phosphodiesterase n=1 Tax=Dactylosporangium matsuzakiense TaxID=53360 RepID=A0A9W6NNA8_9ACTN|nr:GAF domain-containing SpoIIE family protein phosphatase [Dactylosporangium matsuzakiense]UWZ48737.1 SpoIIE family protein phosphatase [Dactylosporangium matsuzakiense]GLL03116.1 cyclic diguanylate phosphodiesterase [Dactylosporangium matsuzakiense]
MTAPDTGTTSGDQLRRIQQITDTALSRLGVEDLLAELLVRARELLQADTATVMLLDPAGTELVATAASGLEREVHQGVRVPVGRGFAGSVAARAEPMAIDRIDETTVVSPVLIHERIAAMLGVPMISGGRLIGVLYVGARSQRRFTPADVELLQLAADRIAPATQARLQGLDRATAYALQRSLLPTRPPEIAGLELAVRYVPGAAVGVGGDWYDVFELPTGSIGVAVGDIAGNGLRAAVVMGRIRSALRAYALETDDPADVLTRLDRKIHRFEPGAMATAIYAVINPGLETVALSAAGHPPPVFAAPGAPAELLPIRPNLPLGTDMSLPRHDTTVALPPGGTLLFYTDGLVERRAHPINRGLDRLVAAVGPVNPDELCTTVMAAMLQDGAAGDDIALLAVRRTATGPR